MARSHSTRTKELLVQSFLIVLSVLLALFLDEARNDYKLGQQREQVLGNVIAELKDNAEELRRVVAYHEESAHRIGAYLDSLEQAGQAPRGPAIRLVISLIDRGIEPPELQRTAWESAQLSPAYGLIPYETTYELARLYDLQADGVETTWHGLAGMFLGLDAYDAERPGPVMNAIQFTFIQLESQEDYLLEETREAITAVCDQMPVPACSASDEGS